MAGGARLELVGVNDLLAAELAVSTLPLPEHCDDARARLQDRLGGSKGQAMAVFSRGGGGATPLALPEMLDILIAAINRS
jgi:hypothetical protein